MIEGESHTPGAVLLEFRPSGLLVQALRRKGNRPIYRLVSFFSLALSKRDEPEVERADIGVRCNPGWRVTDKLVDDKSRQEESRLSTTAVTWSGHSAGSHQAVGAYCRH